MSSLTLFVALSIASYTVMPCLRSLRRVGVVLASWEAGRDAPGGAGGATQGAPPAAPRPYVNLSLRTQGGGCLRQHSLELSLADFKARARLTAAPVTAAGALRLIALRLL